MDNFSQLYVMVVFGVKYRLGLIDARWSRQLYGVIGAKLKELGSMPIAIGGVNDHVHILFSTLGHRSLSDIIREVKTASSHWINSNRLTVGKFGWQKGSGRFSYSKGEVDAVKNYILNQPKHHQSISFQQEMDRIMRRYGHNPTEYDLPESLE